MRVLTVRQPWAWAIIHGGKDVENRTRNIAGSYRGPVAIHAGMQTELPSELLEDVWHEACTSGRAPTYPPVTPRTRKDQSIYLEYGAIIGVVDLVDVHDTSRCWVGTVTDDLGQRSMHCSRWAEPDAHHLVLGNPRALATPIPFKGALGLRELDEEIEAHVWAEVRS